MRVWKRNCEAYRVMHRCAVQYYNQRENWLGIPIIVLSALTGTTGFATVTRSDTAVSISVGAAGFLLTLLGTLRHHFKFHTHTAVHMATEISYARLITKMEAELCKPANRRTVPAVFLDDVAAEYERLLEVGSDIPDRCVEKFRGSVASPALRAESEEARKEFQIEIV